MTTAQTTEAATIPAPCAAITAVPVESDLSVDDLMPRSAKASLARIYLATVAPAGFPRNSDVSRFSVAA